MNDITVTRIKRLLGDLLAKHSDYSADYDDEDDAEDIYNELQGFREGIQKLVDQL